MSKDITAMAGDLVVPAVEAGGSADAERLSTGRLSRRVEPARRSQRGMVSAEWAVGIIAAVAIAGVLLAVVTGGQVQDVLLKFILWVIKGFISVVD